MKNLYQLVIYDTDLSYDNYRESFDIGCFSTYEKAEQTAKQYISTVQGFKDYPCEYEITEKRVVGDTEKELEKMRKELQRSEFCITDVTVNQCKWTEGFVRV